jgi:hypothetical protein
MHIYLLRAGYQLRQQSTAKMSAMPCLVLFPRFLAVVLAVSAEAEVAAFEDVSFDQNHRLNLSIGRP